MKATVQQQGATPEPMEMTVLNRKDQESTHSGLTRPVAIMVETTRAHSVPRASERVYKVQALRNKGLIARGTTTTITKMEAINLVAITPAAVISRVRRVGTVRATITTPRGRMAISLAVVINRVLKVDIGRVRRVAINPNKRAATLREPTISRAKRVAIAHTSIMALRVKGAISRMVVINPGPITPAVAITIITLAAVINRMGDTSRVAISPAVAINLAVVISRVATKSSARRAITPMLSIA